MDHSNVINLIKGWYSHFFCFITQVANLEEGAEKIAEEHPEEAENVRKQLAEINTAWDDLKNMVRFSFIDNNIIYEHNSK